MRQLKLLPGTMLLMLASTLTINPVSAQEIPASGSGETQNQQIVPNTQQIPSRTNTQPVPTPMQMESPSAPSSTPMQREIQQVPSSTETNTVTGTIKSIEGEVVTITMADGMTKEMKVSRADLQRLNLQQGMEISATVDAQSMASNITLAQASSTNAGTAATSSEASSTTTTTEATPTTDTSSETPTTTTENTSSTESTPANRPVRALW